MYENRPRFKVSPTRLQRVIEVLTIGVLLVMLVHVFQAWPSIPERIPQKFDISGQPTRWGGRASVWVLPSLAVGTYALLSILQRMPQVYNYPVSLSEGNTPRLYAIGVSLVIWTKLSVLILIALQSWQQIEVALGNASALEAWIVPTLLALQVSIVVFHVVRIRQEKTQA